MDVRVHEVRAFVADEASEARLLQASVKRTSSDFLRKATLKNNCPHHGPRSARTMVRRTLRPPQRHCTSMTSRKRKRTVVCCSKVTTTSPTFRTRRRSSWRFTFKVCEPRKSSSLRPRETRASLLAKIAKGRGTGQETLSARLSRVVPSPSFNRLRLRRHLARPRVSRRSLTFSRHSLMT